MRPFQVLILWMILLVATASFAQVADFNPWEGPQPMVVLMQTSGWGGGGENPRVAIYEDGTAIIQRETKTNYQYFTKTLSDQEMAGVKERMKPIFEFKDMKGFYDIVRMTDQPSASFYLKQEPRLIITHVEGLEPNTEKEAPKFPGPRSPLIDTLPSEISVFYNYLCNIQFPGTKEWTPKYFEIVTWPVDSRESKKTVIPWPKDWPGLTSDRARKNQNRTSIFIEGSNAQEIRDFFSRDPDNAIFLIDGKKCNARHRPVFPSEPIWINTLFPGRLKLN